MIIPFLDICCIHLRYVQRRKTLKQLKQSENQYTMQNHILTYKNKELYTRFRKAKELHFSRQHRQFCCFTDMETQLKSPGVFSLTVSKQISFSFVQRLVPYGEIVNCEISIFQCAIVIIGKVSSQCDDTSSDLPCTVLSLVIISLQNIIQVQINSTIYCVDSLQRKFFSYIYARRDLDLINNAFFPGFGHRGTIFTRKHLHE